MGGGLIKITLLNIHVPHNGHIERDKTRVLAAVGETCRRAAGKGRRVTLMDANMVLSEQGRGRMANLNAEGRQHMDRMKTLVINYKVITTQVGTPRDDPIILEVLGWSMIKCVFQNGEHEGGERPHLQCYS